MVDKLDQMMAENLVGEMVVRTAEMKVELMARLTVDWMVEKKA